tara:strand:- start:431 stop:655 length:225 start_codon:yes stop_codon:yes gene_type:complete
MNKLLKASIDKYESQKSEALAHLEILFNNSVGIGEHTDILAEIDKWVNSLSQAEENLSMLNNNFNTLFNKSVEK